MAGDLSKKKTKGQKKINVSHSILRRVCMSKRQVGLDLGEKGKKCHDKCRMMDKHTDWFIYKEK